MALEQKRFECDCLQLQDDYDGHEMSVMADDGQIQELNYNKYST